MHLLIYILEWIKDICIISDGKNVKSEEITNFHQIRKKKFAEFEIARQF